jgi:hypothetical protein
MGKKMIKYITKEAKVEEREVASIQCDRCKKDYDNTKDWDETQEFHHIYFTGGYGSVFGDGCKVECNICQHCLKRFIEKHCRITVGMI